MKMKTGLFNSFVSIMLIILIIPGIMPCIADAADGDSPGENSSIDLIIEDLSFNPASPEPGQTVTITATVRNQGTESSGATNLVYYINGNQIGDIVVPEIRGTQSEQISFSWESENANSVEVNAKVDEKNLVSETDEGNNEISEHLTFSVSGLPDLLIDTFNYPSNPEPGESQTIQISVRNQGASTSAETKLRLYINGVLEREWDIPQLANGESSLVSDTWIPESEGSIEIRAIVDEDNTIEETDEGNNQIIGTSTAIENPLPDLIIEDIVPGSSAPQVGNPLNINLRIKNQGTAPSDAVTVRYYIKGIYSNGDEGSVASVPALQAGETTSVPFSIIPVTAGQLEVRGFIDSGTAVYESNETNNQRIETINVVATPPDLIIESLSINPETPKPGQNITFTAKVKNNGPGASIGCKLKYNINGTNGTSGEIYVPPLAANTTTTGTFFWTPSVAEQIEVKLIVDSGTAVSERDETNNELVKTVKVSKKTSSGGGSSSGSSSSSKSSSGGGGAGGSPEPAKNVRVKELSQTFITSGKFVKIEFPNNATDIVSLNFDAKKTVGKTTTIVEMLKNKSTLTPETPEGEVYNYLNIWVGNGGYGSDENNLDNAVINFRVEKSWVQDKGINKSSIAINRYNNKKWNKLPTTLLGEDNKYLYFKAETPGFSPFAITGNTDDKEIKEENKTQAGTTIQEIIGGLSNDKKSTLNESVGEGENKTKKPMGMAKILMAISLPLFMIIIEYFILKKKL